MNENEVKRALDITSTDVQPSRERLRAARATARKRRARRDAFTAAAGGAAASIVAVLAFVNIQGNSGTPDGQAQLNLAAQVEASSSIPVSAEQADSRPSVLVAAAASGRLVRIDAKTGKTSSVIGTFQDSDQKGQLLGGIALSQDKQTVYFDLNDNGSCQPKIMSAPVDGGTARFVVNGSSPKVSSDGASLAYVQHIDCDRDQVVIRSLSSGTETVVGTTSANRIASLTWSPDDRFLVADARYADPTMNKLVRIPSDKTNNIDSTPSVIAPTGAAGTVYEYPSFLPDGRLFVSERCCVTSNLQTSSRLLVVNVAQPSDVKVVAIGFVAKSHTSTAVDASGRHLLYLSGQDLMVSDDNARPSPISYGLVGATWR